MKTPQTDAHRILNTQSSAGCAYVFAGRLERELTTAQSRITELEKERDGFEHMFNQERDAKIVASKRHTALQKDKERLDWLDDKSQIVSIAWHEEVDLDPTRPSTPQCNPNQKGQLNHERPF